MSEPSSRKAPSERLRLPRAALHTDGLPTGELGLPDVHSPEFIAEAHRQSKVVAESPTEEEDQAFVESISWWNASETG